MASTASPSSVVVRLGRNRGFCAGKAVGAVPFRSSERRFGSSAVASAARTEISPLSKVAKEETAAKLDQWVQESIIEIVRHIGEAPFLVHVFSNGVSPSSSPAGLRLQREAASAESWPAIQERWRSAAAPPPDGVILVEELAAEDGGGGAAAAAAASKTWGVLVQGRGVDCASCYILRTCRVRSSAGFCTHFCLAKAKCFGDTAAAQLRSSWLLAQ
ncbi:uncharacterized protein LOC144715809 [Wolffia australiana]